MSYVDLIERLKQWSNPAKIDRIMRDWDGWRKYIKEGAGGSWPRDAFESLVDAFGQDSSEAADALAANDTALSEMRAELERARAANSTRADYDLTCEECGRAHILDTVIPSEIWNRIAEPHNILCTLCIDKRLLAKGLKAEAEFYFVGSALVSKLYDAAAAEAQLALARKALEPFAKAADQLDPECPDLKDTHGWTFQAGDFRAAARALASQDEGEER